MAELYASPNPFDNRPRLRRLQNPETQQYLHWSAQFDVTGTKNAWSGTTQQAANLKSFARVKGMPWPYVLVRLEGKEVT